MRFKTVLKAIQVSGSLALCLVFFGCAASNDYSHYDMAVSLVSQGKMDDAIEEFQQSLYRDPEDPAVYDALAKAYFAKSLVEQAIASWEQALKYSSLDPRSYGPDRHGNARKPQWISDAIDAYKDAFSRLNELYLKEGDEMDARGNAAGAIIYWQKAVNINLKNVDAYRRLGKAYKKSGDADKALEVWQKLVEINPDDADAQKELGYALFGKQMFDDCARAFKQYVKLKPDDPVGYNNLGTVYTKLQKFEAAKDSFSQALAKDPRMVSALNGLASAFFYQGDYATARKYFSKTLELDPDNAKAKQDIKTITNMGY